MMLTPEQQALGRRNFLKVLAGTPAFAVLGAASLAGQPPSRPVRVGFIGVGGQGRSLLNAAAVGAVAAGYADIRALADINPAQLALASRQLAAHNVPPAREYADWREMLQHEDIEAVIMAPPLWQHADIAVGCMEAGKHVLCEKMMAWDVAGCERMKAAAGHNNNRCFVIPEWQMVVVRLGLDEGERKITDAHWGEFLRLIGAAACKDAP